MFLVFSISHISNCPLGREKDCALLQDPFLYTQALSLILPILSLKIQELTLLQSYNIVQSSLQVCAMITFFLSLQLRMAFFKR